MAETDKLLKKILAFREARDWKQFHNPKDLAISLSLEAGERRFDVLQLKEFAKLYKKSLDYFVK